MELVIRIRDIKGSWQMDQRHKMELAIRIRDSR